MRCGTQPTPFKVRLSSSRNSTRSSKNYWQLWSHRTFRLVRSVLKKHSLSKSSQPVCNAVLPRFWVSSLTTCLTMPNWALDSSGNLSKDSTSCSQSMALWTSCVSKLKSLASGYTLTSVNCLTCKTSSNMVWALTSSITSTYVSTSRDSSKFYSTWYQMQLNLRPLEETSKSLPSWYESCQIYQLRIPCCRKLWALIQTRRSWKFKSRIQALESRRKISINCSSSSAS